MKKVPEKVYAAGRYIVTVTLRQTIVIERGLQMKESEMVDEAAFDVCAEVVDWNIE